MRATIGQKVGFKLHVTKFQAIIQAGVQTGDVTKSVVLARPVGGLAGIARFKAVAGAIGFVLVMVAALQSFGQPVSQPTSQSTFQSPHQATRQVNSETSKASQGMGVLEISVFREAKDGSLKSLSNQEILIDGMLVTIGEAGFLRLSVEPGIHKIGIPAIQGDVQVDVDRDRTAVAVLRIRDAVILADVENAANRAAPNGPNIDQANGQSVGGLVGKRKIILKSLDGLPIRSARVFLDEPDVLSGRYVLESDGKGELVFENSVGSGFTVTHRQFETKSFQPLEGEQSPQTEISITLNDATSELEEVRVLAPVIRGGISALVELRRKNRGVAEVLGSEQMARTGDSDAAASLRRVTGLTLVAGKFVYIRGLGERYSSILLNESTLSSPEPARRVVPLDLFPTGVLESVVIEKSYSSELPGEFGGGTIRIGTKPIPDRFSAKVNLGLGIGSDSQSLSYAGGQLDYLGIDDGTRKLPSLVAAQTSDGRRLKEQNPLFQEGFTSTELQAMGRSFKNTWSAAEDSVTAVPSLSVSIGNRFQTSPNLVVGGQIGALFGSDADFVEKKANRFSIGSGGALVSDSDSVAREATREVRLAGTADFGASFKTSVGEQKVSTSMLLLRNSEDSIAAISESNSNGRYQTTELNWIERQLFIRQLRGEHELKPFSIKWRHSLSDATRDAPDGRSHRYILENDRYLFSTRADGNQRSFSNLNDRTVEWGIDVKSVMETASLGRFDLGVGIVKTERNRSSGLRRFHFRDVRTAGSSLDLSKPVEEILKQENIAPDSFQILETTRETDNYLAGQSVNGKSATLDWIPVTGVRFSYGVRHETSEQDVLTYNLFDPENKPVRAGLLSEDILPALGASWEFASKGASRQQLRATYSETVSRPDFKELSTAPYTDEETGQEIIGNNRLRGAILKNTDLRYEWYLNTEESLSLAAFRKEFLHPIEQIIRPGSDGTIRSFDNAESATNTGIEFETRVKLRRVSDILRRFTFATNIALIESAVELSPGNQGVQTSNSRPLQGQSPWVLNLQLFYDRPTSRINAGLLFNMIGPRIREAASGGLPDLYEQPIEQLDAVGSWSMSEQPFTWQVRLKNLLDPETRLTQGDQTALSYRRGRAVSISMSAVF